MAEQEYADFSDMQNPELPEEIEEQNVPDQHMPIGYEENVNAEEPPKKETEEVKPEKETSEKENPDSYKYWQSQADKRDRELREERERREKLEREFEQIKSQINPPKKEEPLKPPQPPQSDDPLEAIEYTRKLAEYQNQLIEQRFKSIDGYFQQQEAERQARIQQEEMARQRAWQVSQLSQHGNLSPEEATQALAEFSKVADTPEQYFKDLAEFYKFRHGKTSKPVKSSGNRQTLPPLGTTASETENQKIDENEAFFGDMQGFIKRNY